MKIDEQLIRSFRRAWALSRRERREVMESEGETKPIRGSGHILESLSVNEGKSQRVLAFEVGIRPQSLSEALGLLEERGEIQRRPDPSDGRVTLVFLTEQGEEKRKKYQQIRKEHARHFFSVLSQEEKEQLLYLLEKIGQSYDKKEET